jgi:hypothetical protein
VKLGRHFFDHAVEFGSDAAEPVTAPADEADPTPAVRRLDPSDQVENACGVQRPQAGAKNSLPAL